MSAKTYHLWREYPVKPFQRFACSVIEDHSQHGGFRIVDWDPSVASLSFLHGLEGHLSRPHPVTTEGAEGRDISTVASPRDPGHFDEAIRSFKGATMRAHGRAA